jgi:hypothetical protein
MGETNMWGTKEDKEKNIKKNDGAGFQQNGALWWCGVLMWWCCLH